MSANIHTFPCLFPKGPRSNDTTLAMSAQTLFSKYHLPIKETKAPGKNG